MAQVTPSLLAEFQSRVDAGQHINSTIHEEAQLLHAFRERAELKRRIENALDLLDGREDASCEPGEERFRPNLEMQIGMALRGEDRP